MIIVIHGDNIEASRNEFVRLKQSAHEKRELDGKTITPNLLIRATESQSMFSEQTTVFIENIFSSIPKQQKLSVQYATILKNSTLPIVLWEPKIMTPAVLKNLDGADIRLFKVPNAIFQFLDHPTLEAYQTIVQSEAPELIHAMLVKRIRHLLSLKDGIQPKELQGWQAARLTHQAKLFTMEKLAYIYKRLLEMEYSVKNGSSVFSLQQLTEQVLIDL